MAGVFLCLEGLDGTGKSTQVRLLAQWIEEHVGPCVLCRDPGQTAIGEKLRSILLDPETQVGMTCEMMLYMASRAQMVEEIILPSLKRGEIVLSDRFLLSTIVYQGHAGGLDPEQIRAVGQVATRGILPVWTGVLDLDIATAAQRRLGSADRIESRSAAFQQMVREGYRKEALRDPRCSLIDASAPPEEVHRLIVSQVQAVLAANKSIMP